jgi:trigger factor
MAQATKDNVRIEDVGPARKRLTITVPPDVIAQKLSESMQTLASETSLPGFRKGHVPTRLLERRFGTAVRTETMNQVIADAYATAIEELELKPIGEPVPTGSLDDLKIEDGKPLEFSLEVEVVPTFELPSLEGIEILRPTLEIADEHIEREVMRLRRELGGVDEIDTGFAAGDRLVGRAVLRKKGESEPLYENAQVLVAFPGPEDKGRGPVLGLMIDDLESTLRNAKVGDAVTVTTTGPEAHEREDIRGAELEIEFSIASGHRITPTTAEDVVERYGMASEDVLREQIRLALEQRRNEEQANVMREQACQKLADQVEIELPEKLTESQSRRQLERYRMRLQGEGMALEEIEKLVAEARAMSETDARSQLKMFFLLQRIAEHFKVEVSEQEINSRIALMAAQRGMRPDKLKNELIQANRLTEFASQIRDQKAADRLVAQSAIKDVTVEAWNEHLKARSAARTGGPGKGVAAPASAAAEEAAEEAPAAKKKTSKKTSTRKKSGST